jgi:hypothetical protein
MGRSVVALAYMIGGEGERIEVMQSSGLDVPYAMRDLFDLSTNRVREYFASHNHQVTNGQLANCIIVLPREPESSIKLDLSLSPRSDVVPEESAPEDASMC